MDYRKRHQGAKILLPKLGHVPVEVLCDYPEFLVVKFDILEMPYICYRGL